MKKTKKSRIQVNPKVHHSIHNRKVFKAKMFLLTFIMVLILLGCATMFTFGTVTWNPDEGFAPAPSVKYPWQAGLVAAGAIVSVATIVAYVLICYKIFQSFYATQAIYLKSAEFKKAKAKALEPELYKLKKSTIKWYKKMCYIKADEKRQALEEQKRWIKTCKENKEKVNYAESNA